VDGQKTFMGPNTAVFDAIRRGPGAFTPDPPIQTHTVGAELGDGRGRH
jgi:hypothetical protein